MTIAKKKNRIVAIILSIMIGLAMSPNISFADDQTVAVVGSTPFTTLQAAITAVADGTVKGNIKLTGDVTESVVIPAGKYMVIDLNGHKITNRHENGRGYHTIENNGILKLRSTEGKGTIDNITYAKGCIMNNIGGTVTVSGNIDIIRSKVNEDDGSGRNGTWYNICNRGTMTINEGVYIENNGTAHTNIATGHLDVKPLFPEVPDCKLTINGATIKGGLNCIKVDSAGILEMNGGTLINENNPAIINWNVATLNDVTIEAFRGIVIAKYTWSGDDTPSEPTEKGITTINGGTFTCSSGIFHKTNSSVNEEGAVVTINGGTFSGPIIPPNYGPEEILDKATVTAYSGEFDSDVTGIINFADDRVLVQGEDGIYRVKTVSENDQDKADAVAKMINELPRVADITLDEAVVNAVNAAAAAYEGLSATQRALLSNSTVEKLDSALDKIDELEAEAAAAEALEAAKTAAKGELDELLAGKKEADYDAEDWTVLTKAITDGKDAIDAAATISAVDEAKNAAINAVAGIKTKAAKAAEALAAAKVAAKYELDNLLAGKKEADYDAEDWTDLKKAITDGKDAIDKATTIGEVEKAKKDAEDAVGNIRTKAEKEAETLEAAKTAAKDELDELLASKTESDYDTEDWTVLTKAITDGKAAIDAATTIEAVYKAKNDAENAVAEIKTKAEKAAEALEAAKTAAKDVLDNLLAGKKEADYDAEDWTALNKAITDGKAAIDAATTIEEVEKAKKDAEDAVGKIKTKEQKDREAAEAVRAKINALPRTANLTLDDKAAVEDAKASYDALTDTQKALVSNAEKEKLDNAVARIKELEEASGGGDDPNQMGKDGTPIGEGASAAAADNFITTANLDKDPKGSKFAPLKFKSSKQGNKNIKLAWTKSKKAAKYVVYGNQCGWTKKMKKLTTVKGKTFNVKKIKKAALKKGKMYKFIIVALNKDNVVVSTSKVIHVATKGGKICNPKKVTVKAKKGKKWKTIKKATVKKGKYIKLKAVFAKQYKKKKISLHAGVKGARYESSNPKIAKANSKGVIIGKKKGSCTVYVYAQNGLHKAIKVKVK